MIETGGNGKSSGALVCVSVFNDQQDKAKKESRSSQQPEHSHNEADQFIF